MAVARGQLSSLFSQRLVTFSKIPESMAKCAACVRFRNCRSEFSYSQTARRQFSQQPDSRKGFFSEFLENVKQEAAKNKEMKESLKKFRDEYERLEQSEALRKARQKFEAIEAEARRNALKEGFSSVQEKIKSKAEEFEKSEYGKKGKQMAEDLTKVAGKTADSLYQQGKNLSESQVYKTVSQGVNAVKSEIDEVGRANLYQSPNKLVKRSDLAILKAQGKIIEANPDATGIELHKTSRFYESWQNFKDNNVVVTKLFDMKTRYDESDHVVVRATRSFTDKVTEVFGGMFSKTELSDVLTEIVKTDPNFNKEAFLHNCRTIYIPNILEAILKGELEVLEDWCHEAPYNILSEPIKEAITRGLRFESRVLDTNGLEIVAGKMMEQGPILVVTFTAQQVMCARNSSGDVVEGDPDKIMRVYHVWAFCRDESILDPMSAWRLIDLSSSPAEQFF